MALGSTIADADAAASRGDDWKALFTQKTPHKFRIPCLRDAIFLDDSHLAYTQERNSLVINKERNVTALTTMLARVLTDIPATIYRRKLQGDGTLQSSSNHQSMVYDRKGILIF